MSRLLKLLILGICAWGILLSACFIKKIWIFFFLLLLGGMFFLINLIIYVKLMRSVKQMNASGKIRNVDYLIIGDIFDYNKIIDDSSSIFSILSPNRSLCASKEILRHTFSILKDGGTVIIVDKGKKEKKYTCLDIVWFHDITIKELGLNKKSSRFPLFSEPINSIAFLLNLIDRRKVLIEMECLDKSIKEFCLKRGLFFLYYKLKDEE